MSTVQGTPDWPILITNLIAWRSAQLPGPDRVNVRLGEQVDLLINNAGIGLNVSFAKSDVADESRLLRLNVESVMRLTHAVMSDSRTGVQMLEANIAVAGALEQRFDKGFTTWPTGGPQPCRAARPSGWRSPGRWPASRACCCSTSRSRRWMPR